MIPPSYLFPVDRLRNGPDRRRRPVKAIASVWPAAIAGALAGGLAAFVVTAMIA